jgi:hypothetical protein
LSDFSLFLVGSIIIIGVLLYHIMNVMYALKANLQSILALVNVIIHNQILHIKNTTDLEIEDAGEISEFLEDSEEK